MKAKAYFRNGDLVRTEPIKGSTLFDSRDVALDTASIIVSDNDIYDPAVPESISSLRIPAFKKMNISAVLDLSYILKMRCGTYEDADTIALFVDKTLQLMQASSISWKRGDYLQVIRNFYRLGMVADGSVYEARFRNANPAIFCNRMTVSDEGEHLTTKYYFEEKIRKYSEYNELLALVPELMPKTPKGYFQIRSRKTAKFQKIKQAAKGLGYVFENTDSKHRCDLVNGFVDISSVYVPNEKNPRYNVLSSCKCSLYEAGRCKGIDIYGLKCNYQK